MLQRTFHAVYVIGLPWVNFFLVLNPIPFLCLVLCLLYIFGSSVATFCTYCCIAVCICTIITLKSVPMAGICAFCCWFSAHTRGTPSSSTFVYLGVANSNAVPHLSFQYGDDMVSTKSVAGVKLVNSGALIECQVDNVILTWSEGCLLLCHKFI